MHFYTQRKYKRRPRFSGEIPSKRTPYCDPAATPLQVNADQNYLEGLETSTQYIQRSYFGRCAECRDHSVILRSSVAVCLNARNDADASKLPEVVVEGESFRDVHLFNHDLACTIRKTPTLITVSMKDAPSLPDVVFCQEINLGHRGFEELLAQHSCALSLAACAEKCKRFVDNIIGGQQWFGVSSEQALGVRVIRISWNKCCEPSAGVNENHDVCG
jgi:hypothetical protein